MTIRSITSFAAALAIAAPCVHAMDAPKPAAEMANLKFFEGRWTCSGEGTMEPGGAPMKMNTTVSAAPGLGGFWQVGSVKGATMAGMPAFEGMFHTTWDPGTKKYLMLWVDNMGGWSESRATGWAADKMVFTGKGGPANAGARDTFVRKADGSFVHIGEMEAKGQWSKVMEETCRK